MMDPIQERCANCKHRKMSDVLIKGCRCEIIILCDQNMHWHPANGTCKDCVAVPPELPPWIEMRREV